MNFNIFLDQFLKQYDKFENINFISLHYDISSEIVFIFHKQIVLYPLYAISLTAVYSQFPNNFSAGIKWILLTSRPCVLF